MGGGGLITFREESRVNPARVFVCFAKLFAKISKYFLKRVTEFHKKSFRENFFLSIVSQKYFRPHGKPNSQDVGPEEVSSVKYSHDPPFSALAFLFDHSLLHSLSLRFILSSLAFPLD